MQLSQDQTSPRPLYVFTIFHRRDGIFVSCVCLLILFFTNSQAQDAISRFQYEKVGAVKVVADGPIDEPTLLGLIEITPNVDIITTSKIRRSIELLYATGNFTNIIVDAEQSGDRVDLTFTLRLVYRFQFIRLSGPTGISGGKIRKQLNLRKLEPYTPEKVLKGRDNILNVLHQHGFYNARVQQDVLLHRSTRRAEVTYQISAGSAAHVADLKFSGEPYFAESALLKQMKSKPGNRFREFNFTKDLEKIESLYDKNGFLEHNIQVTHHDLDTSNRMHLEITIQAGKQLLLQTKGFVLSNDVIYEQIPIRADHSYNDDTLEEGKRNLTHYLQTRGYYDATVAWDKSISEEKILITYTIDPGFHFNVHDIRISGNNHIATSKLLEIIGTSESKLFRSHPLVNKILNADLEKILDAYREDGYIFARFTKHEVVRLPDGKIDLDLVIDEGQQVTVANFRFEGNKVISQDFFLEHFRQKTGMPLSQSKIKSDSNYIIALYSDRGYPKIKLENKVLLSTDKSRAVIDYQVDEGEQVFVDRIVISGNYRTKPQIIKENLLFNEDDPLSLRKIAESQSRLYSLDVFDRVETQLPRPDNLQQYQEVRLKVTESKPYTISYGLGYQTFDKLRGVFALSDRNWLGRDRTLSLQLRGGFEEGRALINYVDPYLFFKRITTNVNGFLEHRVPNDSFSYRSIGTSIQFEKRLSPEAALMEIGQPVPPIRSAYFRYQFQDINTYGTPTLSPIDRPFLAIHISSLGTGFVRDARDNAVDPVTGTYLSLTGEWATSILGSETDFLKIFDQFQYYVPFNKTVIATSLRVGLARGFQDTVFLPISQRFFAGGGRTIRGFEQDTAGPLDADGNPQGGNALFIVNLEYRFPVVGSLGGVVFFDYGNVFALIKTFSFPDLRKTAGIGIRYKTPLGPLTVDWGYKLDRRFLPVRESPSEFFISIGNAF